MSFNAKYKFKMGWFLEPHRHSLAAQGVKTGRAKARTEQKQKLYRFGTEGGTKPNNLHYIQEKGKDNDSKKKIKYGFMVSELTGEVDDLQTTEDKPSHETAGFSYAKWFDTPEQRDKIKKYTEEQIKRIQDGRLTKKGYGFKQEKELDGAAGLSADQVGEILKKYPKAKTIAVENFLMTKSGDNMADSMNLSMDARSYGWNRDTVNAIREGIRTKAKKNNFQKKGDDSVLEDYVPSYPYELAEKDKFRTDFYIDKMGRKKPYFAKKNMMKKDGAAAEVLEDYKKQSMAQRIYKKNWSDLSERERADVIGSIANKDSGKMSWRPYLAKKDYIQGGLADNKSPKDFDFKALKQGIKVEMEHTNNPKIAREIAQDHLTENTAYYKYLAKMEKKMERPKPKQKKRRYMQEEEPMKSGYQFSPSQNAIDENDIGDSPVDLTWSDQVLIRRGKKPNLY
jgi:hypothetical protein